MVQVMTTRCFALAVLLLVSSTAHATEPPSPAPASRPLLPKVLMIAGFAEFGASWVGTVVDAAIAGDARLAIPIAGGIFAAVKAGESCWGGGTPPCTTDYLGLALGIVSSVLQVAGLVVGVVGVAKFTASASVELPGQGTVTLRVGPEVSGRHAGVTLVAVF